MRNIDPTVTVDEASFLAKKKKALRLLIVFVTGTTCAGLIGTGFYKDYQSQQLQTDNTEIEEIIAEKRKNRRQSLNLISMEIFQKVKGLRTTWSNVYDDILAAESAMNQRIIFENVSVSPSGGISIKGKSYSIDSIAIFTEQIIQNPKFSESFVSNVAEIKPSKEQPMTTYSFQLTMKIDPKAKKLTPSQNNER